VNLERAGTKASPFGKAVPKVADQLEMDVDPSDE
jgi:hypothetical protein